eukprot:scaffold230035_cov35-Tisochrysis_lutea.AAC.4
MGSVERVSDAMAEVRTSHFDRSLGNQCLGLGTSTQRICATLSLCSCQRCATHCESVGLMWGRKSSATEGSSEWKESSETSIRVLEPRLAREPNGDEACI